MSSQDTVDGDEGAEAPPTGAPSPHATLHEAAQRAGYYRWAELRLFERLGRWAIEPGDARAKAMFARHAHHHAWHAELWEDRLPVLAGVERDDLVVAVPGRLATLVSDDVLDAVQSDTLDRLVAMYRVVLPALGEIYEAHRRIANPACDEPTIRTLTLCLRDLDDERREAEAVLLEMLDTEAMRSLASTRQGELASRLRD